MSVRWTLRSENESHFEGKVADIHVRLDPETSLWTWSVRRIHERGAAMGEQHCCTREEAEQMALLAAKSLISTLGAHPEHGLPAEDLFEWWPQSEPSPAPEPLTEEQWTEMVERLDR